MDEWAGSIAVKALAYCAEDHGPGHTLSQWLGDRPPSTQQRMRTWWKHWGYKSGEESNWPSHLIKPMAQDKSPL